MNIDYIAKIIIFSVIWFAGCAIVNNVEMHDSYKMFIGYAFGTVGIFASGMNK